MILHNIDYEEEIMVKVVRAQLAKDGHELKPFMELLVRQLFREKKYQEKRMNG